MKIVLFWCILSVFTLGCGKQINNVTGSASDDFPNKIGDTWLYLVNDTTVNQSANSRTASQYTMTVTIVDSMTMPDGEKANVWVYSYPGGADTSYVFKTGDTLRFTDIHDPNISLYSRQYVFPLILQHSWHYTEPSLWQVTVTDQSDVIVGQNRFDSSYHIQGTGGMPDASFTVDEWTEKKVGTVKRYFNPNGFLINTIHVISWSLISYNLK